MTATFYLEQAAVLVEHFKAIDRISSIHGRGAVVNVRCTEGCGWETTREYIQSVPPYVRCAHHHNQGHAKVGSFNSYTENLSFDLSMTNTRVPCNREELLDMNRGFCHFVHVKGGTLTQWQVRACIDTAAKNGRSLSLHTQVFPDKSGRLMYLHAFPESLPWDDAKLGQKRPRTSSCPCPGGKIKDLWSAAEACYLDSNMPDHSFIDGFVIDEDGHVHIMMGSVAYQDPYGPGVCVPFPKGRAEANTTVPKESESNAATLARGVANLRVSTEDNEPRKEPEAEADGDYDDGDAAEWKERFESSEDRLADALARLAAEEARRQDLEFELRQTKQDAADVEVEHPWPEPMMYRKDHVARAKKNDEARVRLFSRALDHNKHLLKAGSTTLEEWIYVHPVVKTNTEWLMLSEQVDKISPEGKKKLFEACIPIVESYKMEPNTFNPGCDPFREHHMAEIKVDGFPRCMLKIDYFAVGFRGYQFNPLPCSDNDILDRCVRIFTLLLPQEY